MEVVFCNCIAVGDIDSNYRAQPGFYEENEEE